MRETALTTSCVVRPWARGFDGDACSRGAGGQCWCWLGGSSDALSMLLVGQEPGDGSDGVVDDVVAAVVAGKRAPVLQVCDAVLDPDPAGSVREPACSWWAMSHWTCSRCLPRRLRGGVWTCPLVCAARPW